MTDTPSEEIIGRIHKLLRLAHGRGATEAEAANALTRANELLLPVIVSVSEGNDLATVSGKNFLAPSLYTILERGLIYGNAAADKGH